MKPATLLFAILLALSCSKQEESIPATETQPADTAAATTTTATTTTAAAEVHPTVVVKTTDPYGEYLADASGRTLYLFTADSKGSAASKCEGKCADAWPPFMYEGDFGVQGNADAALLGKLKRSDGSTQITYGGWPLYYFSKDTAAGDVAGEGVKAFGGEWYLISPAGVKIEKK